MFSQIPLAQPYFSRYNLQFSPRTAAFPLINSTVLPAIPDSHITEHVKEISVQNEKNLDLLSTQIKQMTELSEVQQIEDVKGKLPDIIKNLALLESQLETSNHNLQLLVKPEQPKADEHQTEVHEESKTEESHVPHAKHKEIIKSYEEKLVILIEENDKMRGLIEKNEKKREEELQNLLKAIKDKDEELEKANKLNEEKENIEKNIQKLVSLNEQVKTNYEKLIVDYETQKSRCSVLMDINGELRDSLEIVLHENKKLNRFFSSNAVSKSKEGDDEE